MLAAAALGCLRRGNQFLDDPGHFSDDFATAAMSQHWLFDCEEIAPRIKPFKSQLLKWIGNKQRFAHEIASYFPEGFGTYHEPFLGSGAVLATLAPKKALASDVFPPLIEIWRTLRKSPATLKRWYAERWASSTRGGQARRIREDQGFLQREAQRGGLGLSLPGLLRRCGAFSPGRRLHVNALRCSQSYSTREFRPKGRRLASANAGNHL